MSDLNKAMIIGRLGRDPETRYMGNGKAVTNFSVATGDKWKDKETGEQKERTEWHNVVTFDRLAEIAGEYLTKGSQVYIEGKLQTRKWQDKDGRDRYTTEIVASQLQMLGGKRSASEDDEHADSASKRPAKESKKQLQHSAADEFNDDIPF